MTTTLAAHRRSIVRAARTSTRGVAAVSSVIPRDHVAIEAIRSVSARVEARAARGSLARDDAGSSRSSRCCPVPATRNRAARIRVRPSISRREVGMRVAVLGAGNGGLASALDFAQHGHEVALYSPSRYGQNVVAVQRAGGIRSSGDLEGFAQVPYAGHDAGEAMLGAELVLLVG